MAKKLSLDEYAEANPQRAGMKAYLDTLPDNIREQLLTSPASHRQAADWLQGLGHDRVTRNMVQHWRTKNGWQQ